ncbi:NUDIX domain-containing protein [Streptomyces poonensis]|uniref:NUDIX domain-containing protein n=1 Tax=Streptomyces poonensis TaxID=68255 RepID=UPI001674ECA8|nr:NUDIX domain-containing protein [Streptomyces poonensis]
MHGSDGVLLGWHRHRMWKLAGGTVELGRTFAQAAIRVLREGTGLMASPATYRCWARS